VVHVFSAFVLEISLIVVFEVVGEEEVVAVAVAVVDGEEAAVVVEEVTPMEIEALIVTALLGAIAISSREERYV
jgi:hypothetical protein